ncbi:energy transducer TonB [Psychroserpens ponticola]|uniref:Energy transducer TonB n=1 Tax=Psychroserpens ponticola TaxID=2932268 RepID=A0ABY7RW04_9FLAO|nr:energy transducer TonB [Psychroserpens ponticola]WCO01018.1 energy transducer TonB [Psychroserpens ponticola]
MKYLKTKHQRNSAKITTLIMVILILLLFVVGHTYMDPPEEYGVAVNFGNSPVGSGNIQPTEPIKSRPTEHVVKEETQADKAQPEETTQANNQAEDVLTTESAEAIAIKKAEEAKAKAKAEAERQEQLKKEEAIRKAKEEQDKKDKLDALIGGVKNSEGPTKDGEGPGDGPGDKGDLDGSPYAPYKGTPGSGNGGVGYGLNGRGTPDYDMFDGCENEYGLIVVDIVVNRNGQVIEATPGAKGSNNATTCLKTQAKKIAKSYKWPADSKAPARQYGKVSVNFTPTN